MLMNTIQHEALMNQPRRTEAEADHEHALRMARVNHHTHSLIDSHNVFGVAGTNGASIVYGYMKAS